MTAALAAPRRPSVEAVRARVRAACAAPENRFGPDFLEQHLAPVARLADALAVRLGADRPVVALAAWLHDLAALRDYAALARHEAEGAALARALLREEGWPAEEAEAVARCVAAHGTPARRGQAAAEVVCLSQADVLAQLERPAYWCWYLYQVRGLPRAAGLAWLRERLGARWEALCPEAQALGAASRARLAALLEGAEEGI